MSSAEILPGNDLDPRLRYILEQYGNVLVLNHEGQPQPLAQAVDECPPFIHVLLGTESEEQLIQIIDVLKAPE